MTAAPTEGITTRAVIDGGETVVPLAERILGRTVLNDVAHPDFGRSHLGRRRPDRRRTRRQDREGGCRFGADPFGPDLQVFTGHLRHVLWARSRPRHAGERRRSGGCHRGAVDRRAGHAADDADVPHRRRGTAWRGNLFGRGVVRRQGQDQQPQRGQELVRHSHRHGP